MKGRRAGRWAMLTVAGVALLTSAQVVNAPEASAAAPPALEKRVANSGTDSVSPKTAVAVCTAGKRVVGGGGWVFAIAAADEAKVMLTRLEPVHSGNLDSYVATGEEVAPGMSGTWWVEAYAICAPTPSGYEITSGSTAPSSSPVQQTAAVCPSPKRVIGTGSQINNPGGQVTLQLNRSSGPRDIVRVTAKEDANGYAAAWNVTAYAICANPLAGFDQHFQPSPLNSSNTKVVDLRCPVGTFVHSAGVATSGIPPGLDTTPPGVAVQVLFPFNDLQRVRVAAVETTPTNAFWEVAAFAICGP